MSLFVVLLVLVLAVLALAWYDGGREEQRQIVESITLPEPSQ